MVSDNFFLITPNILNDLSSSGIDFTLEQCIIELLICFQVCKWKKTFSNQVLLILQVLVLSFCVLVQLLPSVQQWALWQNGWYLMALEKEPRSNNFRSSVCSFGLLLQSWLLVLVLQTVIQNSTYSWCPYQDHWAGAMHLCCQCGCDPGLEYEMLTAGVAEGDDSSRVHVVILVCRWNTALSIS